MTDSFLMKKLKCYVNEKQRPFLSFLKRRGEVIICGDKNRSGRIRVAPALMKALKEIFLDDFKDNVDVQEFTTDEEIVLPPLNFHSETKPRSGLQK